jgi:hypothetical protein
MNAVAYKLNDKPVEPKPVSNKPFLRFHPEETRFDGQAWQVAFTPRGIAWEPKQVRPVPDEEMRRIWKAYGIAVELDEVSVKKQWRLIEGSIKNYLIREYWSLDEKKRDEKKATK